MKKTSLVPLMVVCQLLAVPLGTKRDAPLRVPVPAVYRQQAAPARHPLFTPIANYIFAPNGNLSAVIVTGTGDKWWTKAITPLSPVNCQWSTTNPPRRSLSSFGENSIVLSLLAVMASLCAVAFQRYRRMKSDIRRDREEALRKARELMEQEKQTALQLAYRLIREEKEMALRQARETAVKQAREIIEQAREEARELQAKVTSASVQLANRNDYLQQLQEKLRTADNNDCKRFAKEIKTNLGDTDHWAEFIANFNLLHSNVIDKVIRKHPDLTTHEIKLVCFVLSGVSNKEIAGAFAVEPESVKKARYRLKKKLHLKEEESLKYYLDSLD